MVDGALRTNDLVLIIYLLTPGDAIRVQVTLMVGVLYWKAVMAVWDIVSRPFRRQVDDVVKFLQNVNNEYKEVTTSCNS